MTLRDAIREYTGIDIFVAGAQSSPIATWPELAPADADWAQAVHKLYDEHVEPNLLQPTIVFDFPFDVHPCAVQHAARPELARCFDIVMCGIEIGSGGEDVTDPDEQLRRFAEQPGKAPGGPDAHPSDHDYVEALQYGAPPASGAGIGIDRLLMVLFDSDGIHSTAAFPVSR